MCTTVQPEEMSAPTRPAIEETFRRTAIVAMVASAQFLIVLDGSVMNIALPSIGTDLRLDVSGLSWVQNAYTLTFGACLLLGGRLADLYPPRRLFVVGMLAFAAASLSGGLAHSAEWFMASRAVQGLAAALVAPTGLVILAGLFDDDVQRYKAVGVWGTASAVAGPAGAIIGGALTQYAGWRWLQFINVPAGVAAATVAATSTIGVGSARPRGLVDWPGALLLTGAMALFIYGLIHAGSVEWQFTKAAPTLAGSVIFFAALIWVEARSPEALVPMQILRIRNVVGANIVAVLASMTFLSMAFFLTLYMQQILGYQPLGSGLAWVPLGIALTLTAHMVPQLIGKFGAQTVMTAGMLIGCISLAWFSQVTPNGSFMADILGPSLLAGVGLGLVYVASTITAVTSASDAESGLASGLVTTAWQLGATLGLSVLVAVTSASTALIPTTALERIVINDAFRAAFGIAAILALAGAVMARALLPRQPPMPADVKIG